MGVVDRTEINKELAIENYFPTFFSVLLPELGRPDYVTQCVERLHNHADMPFEAILHDDGSGTQKQELLFDRLKDKVSTIIFNRGYNTGLARSMNRCRAMASSKYLMGFNVDVFVTSSFFKHMKAALDLPYVGLVNIVQSIKDGPGVYITPEGIKIQLQKNMGTCHCFGIRSEVWDEVGGWDENVQTTSSDVGFVGSVFGAGYFTVAVEGTATNEMWPKSEDGTVNIGGTNPDYVDSTIATRNDNNVPPIFGMHTNSHSKSCEKRREEIWRKVNIPQNKNPLQAWWYNGKFQVDQLGKLYPKGKFIDWEFAKEYGHYKWKDRIIKDFKLNGS